MRCLVRNLGYCRICQNRLMFLQGALVNSMQWRNLLIWKICAENCMKMKEIGPRGGRASIAPPPIGSANTMTTANKLFPTNPPCAGCVYLFVRPITL